MKDRSLRMRTGLGIGLAVAMAWMTVVTGVRAQELEDGERAQDAAAHRDDQRSDLLQRRTAWK